MPALPIIKVELSTISIIIQYIDCGQHADAAEAFKYAIELKAKNHNYLP